MLKRSLEKELIDLGPEYYTKQEYEDFLCKLDRIGRWLGGDLATFSALPLDNKIDSILDVGCGGGFFTARLAKRFPQTKVVGIEINYDAIEIAKKHLVLLKQPPMNLTFEWRRNKQMQEKTKSFDVVMSTLVCHHMQDEEFANFLSDACRIAKKKVIINDLHRHPLALLLFKMTAPLFFQNRLICYDGSISIRRAFKRNELKQVLHKAGLNPLQYSIRWHWAFRWIIEIDLNQQT